MSDQSRVITGYDCEFLIGGNYFARIFASMFRSSGGAFGSGSFQVKGSLTQSSFAHIEGIDTTQSTTLYNFLEQHQWIKSHTLVDDFDPLDPDLQSYLAILCPDAQAVTNHLELAQLDLELTVEEPYQSTLFDDKLQVDDLLRKVFVSVTESDIDFVIAALTTKHYLNADGRLAVAFDSIRAEISAWLDEALPTHKLGFTNVLKTVHESDLSVRDALFAALLPLNDAKLEALIAYMDEQKLISSGGYLLAGKSNQILRLLRDWLTQELPDLKDDIIAVLKEAPTLEIHFPIDLHGTHTYADGEVRLFEGERNEIVMFIPFELNARQVLIGTPIICHESKRVLDHFGTLMEIEGMSTKLPTLFAAMEHQYDLDMVPSDSVIHIDFKKLKSDGPYAPAYGIYCNLNLDLRALPKAFEMEYYNKPMNVVGESIEVAPEGHLVVKDKDGVAIDPQHFLYSSDAPDVHNDTLLYYIVGNIALRSITLDDDGHLVIETKNGAKPTPAEIVALAERNLPRGNIHKASNFLRTGSDFAVGIGQTILRRYEKSLWNTLYVPLPEDIKLPFPVWPRPMKDEWGKQVGSLHNLDLRWHDGWIECTVDATYYVPIAILPNAEVHCRIAIRPYIRDYKLCFDAEVQELTADTGLLGDFAALLIGALVFAPFAITFGFPGLLVLGVPGLEITESILANSYKDDVASAFSQRSAQLFDSIPAVLELFSKPGSDIAYQIGYGPSQLYDSAHVDQDGLVLMGRSGIGEVCHPNPVILIGRTRSSASTWDLVDLIYRDRNGDTANVPADYAGFRIRQGSLTRQTLIPVAQFRSGGHIHSLKFDSGVDLRIEEIIQLMRDRVIDVPRVRIHVSSTGREYLRSVQDIVKSNNLGALPRFRPADLPGRR